MRQPSFCVLMAGPSRRMTSCRYMRTYGCITGCDECHARNDSDRRQKDVIFICLAGGPPQQDICDLKAEVPISSQTFVTRASPDLAGELATLEDTQKHADRALQPPGGGALEPDQIDAT